MVMILILFVVLKVLPYPTEPYHVAYDAQA